MSIEIRNVIDPINGEPMPNVKQLRLGKHFAQMNSAWAEEIERLQTFEQSALAKLREIADGHAGNPQKAAADFMNSLDSATAP